MNKTKLDTYFANHDVLIADGATGSNLIARGLPGGKTAEHWVIENPKEILKLHADFINSGSDIILTSTFGGSRIRLKHTGLDDQFKQVNVQAVQIALEAVGNSPILIAGSMGPLGQMLKPLGPLEVQQAKEQYAAQAELLASAGVDMLLVETQFDLTEACSAIEGIRSVDNDIGLICSFSFDRGTKTMMGVTPSQFAQAMQDYDLSSIGINCGKSLSDNQACLVELSGSTHLPIWYKPNAGLPTIDSGGNATYSLLPQQMGVAAEGWPALGACIMGGCCGTSPDHLQEIAKTIK